ncbi:unnamed protein product [Sphagnum troendelagicum]|uniref:Uncharacterized protein n=1 Tax=Sphagnum troendelagicum TaxID=128251 RepID=A0ABP0TEP5_9BRYO
MQILTVYRLPGRQVLWWMEIRNSIADLEKKSPGSESRFWSGAKLAVAATAVLVMVVTLYDFYTETKSNEIPSTEPHIAQNDDAKHSSSQRS